jgi:acetyl-CoA synthetase
MQAGDRAELDTLLALGRDDPERLWGDAAARLPWLRPFERVFEADPPSFRWFLEGETNLCFACLDHHVAAGQGDRTAVVYLNERGERRDFTYSSLLDAVERAAAALRALGVGRGDRITIYMPVCPEALVTMLAAVRIGAIHSVVFAGFGPGALAERISSSGSRLVVCADLTYRKGANVRLKEIVDDALALGCETVERVVLASRAADPPLTDGRDLLWEDFLAGGAGGDRSFCPLEANEPAWILATSGTTATPKLTVQAHGGYAVGIHAMARWCFGLRAEDVWWSTSDIGWVVGHSYILYAPLLVGCTTLAYEGALDHPGPDSFWRTIEELRVSGIFTSPTAVRLLMRHGDDVAAGSDLSSLERVFCAGEVLNPPAWEWLQETVLDGRIPVVDHWWQTETGGPVLGNPYGVCLLPIKPGSAGIALPGMDVGIVTLEGADCGPGEKGMLVIRRPFPSLTASLWGDPARYGRDYWERVPGQTVYSTGDSAHMDEDGYLFVAGRADEVIKIAAHRIGTIEVETAFLKHRAVAEAGVTGRPDELRGEVIAAFIVLKDGHAPSETLREELLRTIRRELGPVAVVGDIEFVGMLPKTRSGKIMRHVLKAVVTGQDPGDVATIEDEGSVDEARQAWTALRGSATPVE